MENISQITLNDVNKKFLETYPKKSQVINVVSKFILTEFGLMIKGRKISCKEKNKAKQIAQKVHLINLTSELISICTLESFKKYNIPPAAQIKYKSSIDFYLKFINSNFNLDLDNNALYRLQNNPSRIIDKTHLKNNKQTRQRKEVIAIRLSPDFYLKDYRIIYPDLNRGQIVNVIQRQLGRINDELQGFENFCRQDLENEEETANFYLGYIQRLLGWLYIQEKDLEKVSITNLIPIIDRNLKLSDYDDDFDRYALAKEKCKCDSKKAAKEVRNFLSLFFKIYGVVSFTSQEKYIVSLINLAKYLYKDITDGEDVEDYEDIVIIQSLRNFRRKLKKNSPCCSNIKNLKFTWDELLIIREQLKFEASLKYSYSQLKNGRTHRDSRSKSAIATSKMRFLIFCLLTIIPPDRARTIRELRIGETLKHGLKTKFGFVTQEKLSNSAQAKYYIHLLEKDYKTGKTYGEFWGELPNCQFKDDTKFYDYLNDWIYGGWREVLLRDKAHNYCFCQSRGAKQHNKGSFSGLVANIFENKTGIKMGTHEFRDIFCTYLEEVNASPEVRRSAAYWMKHSEEIAKKIYTVVDLQAKLAPAFEFMNRLNF